MSYYFVAQTCWQELLMQLVFYQHFSNLRATFRKFTTDNTTTTKKIKKKTRKIHYALSKT